MPIPSFKKLVSLFFVLAFALIAGRVDAAGRAPAFALKDLQGREVTLQQFRGKVVLVNFWATWCVPCKTEIPWLMQLQKTYGPDRFVVLGVSMDEEGAKVVAPWIASQRFVLDGASHAVNFPILLGNAAAADRFGEIEGMPTTFLIDQSGALARRIDGAIDLKDVDRSVGALLSAKAQAAPPAGTTPAMGQKAHEFSLANLDGKIVRLSDELKSGPVVLIMLRGWPGYQCPFCTRQFGDYLANAEALKAAGARVVFVYPGPGDGLIDHAKEFTAKGVPGGFTFLVDPDYQFTKLYGLRWDAPKETSYPSTFVLNAQGVVTFGHTSHEHGDRVTAADVLKVLQP